jgi:hypothetical protein
MQKIDNAGIAVEVTAYIDLIYRITALCSILLITNRLFVTLRFHFMNNFRKPVTPERAIEILSSHKIRVTHYRQSKY